MSLLDEVKQRADIVQVVSKYTELDTSSRTPKALCPFHSERSPSFVVYPESGTWHCFGACATGGDAISFVMKRENIPFNDALRRLADDLGIKATDTPSGPRRPVSDLYEANEVAARYFLARLKSSEGEAARAYLAGRGITLEAAERRGLGLAPAGLETLSSHLRSKNVDPRAARDAGLVTRSRDGAWRDMFRGRLTVEIRDAQGRLCGFGARTLDGSEPKYLNTAKSETFDKGRLLYGLNWAQDTVRATGRAVVVEGYMDAIAAHEHGIADVVACMGTAVTADQLEALARLVARPAASAPPAGHRPRPGTIVLCLDSDAAGEQATLRELSDSWRLLSAGRHTNVEVRVARPEGGKDPDEAIRTSREAWLEAISRATPFIEWMLEAHALRVDPATSAGKAALFEAVRGPILAVQNTYEQDRYWTLLARKMGVPEERVRAMLNRPAAGAGPRRAPHRQQREERLAASQVAAALGAAPEDAIEDHLLALLLAYPDLREYALAVPPEHFRDAAAREVFAAWSRSPETGMPQPPIDDPLASKIEHLKNAVLPPSDQLQRVEAVSQCVRRLRERHLRLMKTLEMQAFSGPRDQISEQQMEDLLRRATEADSRLRQVFTGHP